MNKHTLLMLAMSCSWFSAQIAEVTAATRVPLPVVEWPTVVDITDTDLLINSSVQLPVGETVITADEQNISVRLDEGLTISGSDLGQSILVFNAAANRTITVEVSKDLTFKGTAGNTQLPLLIYIVGQGTVVFSLYEGDGLEFSSDNNGGGVELYCIFDGEEVPTCIFEHHDIEQLSFGVNCMMGYLVFSQPVISAGKGIQLDSDHVDAREIKIKYKHNSSIPLIAPLL